MSDLDDAVRDRIADHTPALVPPYSQLQKRRRARRRIQWSVSLATLGAVAAAVTGLTLVQPGGTTADDQVLLGTQPMTLAAQFDGYVESSDSTWPTERDGAVSGTRLVRGPAHCVSKQTLWLRSSPSEPLQEGSWPAIGYLRDPNHTSDNFAKGAQPFLSPAALPSDAKFTGVTVGVAELWLSPVEAAQYVYVVNSRDRNDVERWPALVGLCA